MAKRGRPPRPKPKQGSRYRADVLFGEDTVRRKQGELIEHVLAMKRRGDDHWRKAKEIAAELRAGGTFDPPPAAWGRTPKLKPEVQAALKALENEGKLPTGKPGEPSLARAIRDHHWGPNATYPTLRSIARVLRQIATE